VSSLRVGALLLLTLAFAVSSRAQNTIAPQSPVLEAPSSSQPRAYRTTGTRVAIGRSIQVPRDEEVTDAVIVIGGSLRVDGRVREGIVVVGGNVDLGPESEVSGDVVVVGGRLVRETGAQLHGSVSDVSFGEWAPWTFGRLTIPAFDFGDFGRWFALFGTVFRISLLAVLMAMFLILARAPVARIGHAAAAAPARAFFTGLAAEILFVPVLVIVCIGLVVTIIGIPLAIVLVPIAVLTGFIAMILGFTALATRVGEWLQDRAGRQTHSAYLAALMGLIVVLGPTLLARAIGIAPWPLRFAAFGLLISGVIVEFVVWTMGLGATLMTGFGRWSIAPPPIPPPTVLPVVVNA